MKHNKHNYVNSIERRITEFSGLKSIIIPYFSIMHSKIIFFAFMSKSYQIRCCFDLKFEFSALKYIVI